ncbi:MAG: cadmium-translocating P-type ATPase [Verrucomicrobia bacterium]|nr:cadmium-translocating P-type ATPase [Verrucomicrobiota bacterium]
MARGHEILHQFGRQRRRTNGRRVRCRTGHWSLRRGEDGRVGLGSGQCRHAGGSGGESEEATAGDRLRFHGAGGGDGRGCRSCRPLSSARNRFAIVECRQPEAGVHSGVKESDPACAAEKVARVVAEEPSLGAVTIRPGQGGVEIETVGPAQSAARRVGEALTESAARCDVDATGHCSVCGAGPERQEAIGRVSVTRSAEAVVVTKEACPTSTQLRQKRRLNLPEFTQREPARLVHGHEHGHEPHEHGEDEWKTLALLAGGCLVLGLVAWSATKLGAPFWLQLLLWAVCYLCGGWEAAEESWEKLRHGRLDVHFLMLTVALGAAAVGDFAEGALLLFLFSASGAMEHYAEGRTRREIGALVRAAPKTASVVEADGSVRDVPVEALVPGQRLRVTGGQIVPVDLRIVLGESACDESNLTGEARPVPKSVGDTALGGTLNGGGLLEGQVLRPAAESALARIIRLIEQSQKMRAPSQRFTDRFGSGYTYAVLGLCAAMFLVWWLALGLPAFRSTPEQSSAFYRAMTLLVVASPCALVLSIPSAILSAIAAGAKRGVLFRGGAAIEALAEVQAVAMDKTGTLTEGHLQVVDLQSIPAGHEEQVARVAYNLDRFSDHPLARATQRWARQRGVPELAPEKFQQVPGRGLQAELEGVPVRLGRHSFAAPQVVEATVPAREGAAAVWVDAGGGVVGRLLYVDRPRPAAAGVLRALEAQNIETIMLTGDRQPVAEKLAAEVGLRTVRAELLPDDKVREVEALKQNGARKVAMIGDGVNDAPCLAAADVGVAMGARGSDAALEQAEIVLMNDRLENFLLALELSRRARAVIRQNLAISLGVVVVMVGASLFGLVPLTLGVVAHEGSTVVVVLNSLRLLLGGAR